MIYLAVKYAIFALLATITNISTQYITLNEYSGPLSLYMAMLAGTMAGLVVKYILDKKYIFYHKTKNKQDNLFKFILYSFMGVFTTLIFWGIELFFNAAFNFPEAKYIGAATGLTIGYIIKYFLDKKFVFRET